MEENPLACPPIPPKREHGAKKRDMKKS